MRRAPAATRRSRLAAYLVLALPIGCGRIVRSADIIWPKWLSDGQSEVCQSLGPLMVKDYQETIKRANRVSRQEQVNRMQRFELTQESFRTLAVTRDLCGLLAAGKITVDQFQDLMSVASSPENYQRMLAVSKSAADSLLIGRVVQMTRERQLGLGSDSVQLHRLRESLGRLAGEVGQANAKISLTYNVLEHLAQEGGSRAGGERGGAATGVTRDDIEALKMDISRISERLDGIPGGVPRALFGGRAAASASFRRGSAVLSDSESATLAAQLHDQLGRPVLFSIVGSADPSGPADFNIALAEARAAAVARWLMVRYDVPPARITIASLGSTTKYGATPGENRRVTVYVLAGPDGN